MNSNHFSMTLAASLLLAIAVYAHLEIPHFTASGPAVLLARAILIVIGIAVGYVAAITFPAAPGLATLAFLIGFGLVHVPAGFILFVKRERESGKS